MITRTTALIAAGGVLAGAAVIGIPAIVVAATDDDRPGPGRFMDDEDWSERGSGMMRGRRGEGMMGDFGGPGAMMGGGPGGWRGDGDGWRGGMMGGGMMGGGMMGGPLGWSDGEPAGELTDAQADDLAVNAEREKLARDLYTAFADATGDVRFSHLAMAESHHLRALQTMLDVYEVTDPTEGNGPGEFSDGAVAADYESMLEEGSGSEDAALEVAREIEESFTEELGAAADDVEDDAEDVASVYEHLAFASEHHLDLLEE